MKAGFAFIEATVMSAAYTDYGISNGMKEGIRIAEEMGHEIDYREIGEND